MDSIHILEGKVVQLVERVRALKQHNQDLAKQNLQLEEKVELLETSLLSRDQSSREIAEAQALVDVMIQSINEAVECLNNNSNDVTSASTL